MAKAVTRPRGPALPAASVRGNYLKEVWEELKKVLWPTREELTRMTGIVVATVCLFAGIIGLADYGLGLVVKQLYAAPGTAQRPAVAPSAAAVPPPARRNGATVPAHPSSVPAPAGSSGAPTAPTAPAPGAPVPQP